MCNILSKEKQITVLQFLLEGNSISSTARITRVHRDTITKLMVRFGSACKVFLDERMRNLQLAHVQVDEMWSFVKKKAKNVTGDEPDIDEIGEFYIYIALDEATRLVPCFLVDRRNEAACIAFMMDLASRFKWPTPHESDAHIFQEEGIKPFTRISTDAFAPYPLAVNMAFGKHAAYGQIVKETSAAGVETAKRVFNGKIKKEDITTSLVERNNLTLRTFLKRLNRRTCAFSKKLDNLRAATAMFIAHYNFVWAHRGLGGTTPAMRSGITGRRWSLCDLYEAVKLVAPEHFLGR